MRIRCLCRPIWILLVVALATSPAAAATLVGPPTYSSLNFVDIQRGSGEPGDRVAEHSSAYAGSGGSTASVSAAFTTNASQLPTEAFGQSTATRLRSLSRVTGELLLAPPNPPYATARNTSSVTRFWEFSSSQGANTVDLDFLYFLDGTLHNAAFAELVLPTAWSRVDLSLDVVNPAGSVLQTIFSVEARASRVPTGGYALTTLTTGVADPTDWANAITPIANPEGGGVGYAFNYFGRFENAYTAPVGTPVGLRWTLGTEAHAEGSFAFNLFLESAFRDTAEVGFEPSPGQLGVSFEEVLSVPVPEPSTATLLGLGLALALLVRPHRRGRSVPGR